MSANAIVEVMRVAWLTLAFMMLLSRIAFQAAGAVRMRAFLDIWQVGLVKRVWGGASLTFAAVVAALAVPVLDELGAIDLALLAALLLVLAADGVVNVLPAGFETFKSRMQEAWVARHRGTERATDRYLFATVNALLAALSAAVVVLVIAYRPIPAGAVALAAVLATVLTALLIAASVGTARD